MIFLPSDGHNYPMEWMKKERSRKLNRQVDVNRWDAVHRAIIVNVNGRFLNPLTNKRVDRYGCGMQRLIRFVLNIL